MEILHNQEGSKERQNAIQEAAYKPELFRELAETHAEASDNALRSYLVVKKGFSEAGANNFVLAFKDTLALVKAGGSGYSLEKSSEEDRTMAGTTLGDSARVSDSAQTMIGRPGVHVFSWPLPNNTMAELRLTGGPITQEHLEMLRKYLELAKAAVPKTASD